MSKKITFPKGILYSHPFIYNFLTKIKLKNNYHLRYKIATQYIQPGNSVLDVCAGQGGLKNFLPKDCDYICIEAGSEFISELFKKKIKHFSINLHEGINIRDLQVDVIVMIVSLYQFRNTSIHNLLEDFKKITKKAVIVEEVLLNKRSNNCICQKILNYLCASDYYIPTELFSIDEFEQVMHEHNYKCKRHSERYVVGYYNY